MVEMEPWKAERAAAFAAYFAAAAAFMASSERGDPDPPRSSRSLNRRATHAWLSTATITTHLTDQVQECVI